MRKIIMGLLVFGSLMAFGVPANALTGVPTYFYVSPNTDGTIHCVTVIGGRTLYYGGNNGFYSPAVCIGLAAVYSSKESITINFIPTTNRITEQAIYLGE